MLAVVKMFVSMAFPFPKLLHRLSRNSSTACLTRRAGDCATEPVYESMRQWARDRVPSAGEVTWNYYVGTQDARDEPRCDIKNYRIEVSVRAHYEICRSRSQEEGYNNTVRTSEYDMNMVNEENTQRPGE